MRKIILGVVATVFIGTFATDAAAHARLIKSDPRAGTTVSAPRALQLWFSETIIGDKSSVTLAGRSGAIGVGKIAVDPGNRRVVHVPLPQKLGAGAYKVSWTMTTADTHTMDGSFAF